LISDAGSSTRPAISPEEKNMVGPRDDDDDPPYVDKDEQERADEDAAFEDLVESASKDDD
jgi:hypothetical protein